MVAAQAGDGSGRAAAERTVPVRQRPLRLEEWARRRRRARRRSPRASGRRSIGRRSIAPPRPRRVRAPAAADRSRVAQIDPVLAIGCEHLAPVAVIAAAMRAALGGELGVGGQGAGLDASQLLGVDQVQDAADQTVPSSTLIVPCWTV